MGRYAKITDNIIENIIESSDDFALKENLILANSANIGDVWDGVKFIPAPKKKRTLQEMKSDRLSNIKSIVVKTASGNSFNGDEISQQRMLVAITIMNGAPIKWIMADETIKDVTKAELTEALKLASNEMFSNWVAPYL